MKAKGHRWVGLRQNEDSCSKVLECSDPLLIVMPKMRSADGKITVPPYDGRCASDLGDKMFINSLDLGLEEFKELEIRAQRGSKGEALGWGGAFGEAERACSFLFL
jgi:hypothetical protein